MIYCLYIFHRQYCIFYCDWNRTRKPPRRSHHPDQGDECGQREEQKLLSGLLFSLKSFSQKLDPQPQPEGQVLPVSNPFNSFTTALYKLHYFETPTGYKFVMMTDPSVADMKESMKRIYSDLFVQMVVRNASYEVGSLIESPEFEEALTSMFFPKAVETSKN
eukprot:Selendium_serpulae@DN5720_c0_g1_i1.p1